ncbi:hypothetical protein AB0F95_16985 [Micromonospora tulbaghiae]|uniref:hypothetical protein n=1 Tax=Micromonospora tulbaghiae TaxID=479978 RepID=UPI0033CF51F9
MSPASQPRADGAGIRKKLTPATVAALWTVSNGKCYAPGCPMPVVLEVRPGIYRKNAQVAHVYGVKPGAARYRGDLPAHERDSFSNLILLCLGHHEEVDGDAQLYPPELLKQWKVEHEGADSSVLSRLKVTDVATLMKALTELAAPPLERLEVITKQLEETGTVTAETVAELKQIIRTMSSSESGIDARTARALAQSAEVFGTNSFDRSARALAHAAEVLPSIVSRMERSANRLSQFH